jgi:hypothetical protein
MTKKKGVFELVPWKWVTCDECEGKGEKKVAWVFSDEDESFLR